MSKRFVVAVLLLLPTFVLGYTSPGKPSGYVNDFANILKPEIVADLNTRLEQLAQDTGDEISVVTINSLGDETVETYAEKLFQEWGIGKDKEDNGLLLLISAEDREVRIEVGYGLEPVVTDIASSRIIREILIPSFQKGDFNQGVTSAVDSIVGLIGGESLPDMQQETARGGWASSFPYLIFAFMYLGAILARSKSWWAGGIIGGVLGFIFLHTILLVGVSIIVGLLFDFLVSRTYNKHVSAGTRPPWFVGGGGFGGRGGFGGGMSGGGGASGRW